VSTNPRDGLPKFDCLHWTMAYTQARRRNKAIDNFLGLLILAGMMASPWLLWRLV
jgi:hypothetical protein